MKTLLVCLLSGIVTFSACGQKSPIKFGEIPMEDLNMTTYEKDSSAEAIILCDYGEAYLNAYTDNVNLTFERHIRIKILKKGGLKWANASIPTYFSGSSEEKVSSFKASTYNLENGKLVETKMSKEGIFKEKFNRHINLQKFTFPNVREGSVIEYSYNIISQFFTNFPNWRFQESIPIRHTEYWAIIPDFFIYEKYMQGYVTPTNYEIKPKTRANGHHWVIKDVPAFKVEPYMTSEDDYVSKINFALSHIDFPGQPTKEIMGSWKKLNDDLLEDEEFGKVIKGSGFLKKQVEEITSGISDPIQKITAILNYLKQNFEWDGEEDFYASPLKKIIERKRGSSGDLNLLLASMLEKADLQVDMVLLSTRDHGFIRKQYPMTRQFNYVICAVTLSDKTLLLDATEKYLPLNMIPKRCINGEGLVISATRHGWINLETNAKTRSRTVVMGELVLENSGDLKGKLDFAFYGYDATQMRNDFISKGEDIYVREFIGSKPWEMQKSEFQNIKEMDRAAKANHEITIREHAAVAGDVIYLNPFVTSQIVSNPFTLDKREYPVDFGTATETMYICKFTIPEGYAVDETPQNRVLVLPDNTAKYTYNISQVANSINVISNFQINKNIFSQEEYPHLREFYNQVVAKQAEQIVLKKK